MRSSSLRSVFPHIQAFLGSFQGAALTKQPSSGVKHLKGLFITHIAGKSSLYNTTQPPAYSITAWGGVERGALWTITAVRLSFREPVADGEELLFNI